MFIFISHEEFQRVVAAITEGFEKVAEAISNPKPPEPPPDSDTAVKGEILSRYKFDSDQDPVTYSLVVKNLTSSKGKSVGAQDIDISVESSIPAITATLGTQVLSEDGKSVSADLTLTGNAEAMENVDLCIVTYKGTNRDTGNVVVGDSDEFVTGPPEAAMGEFDSPVPLPEVV